ncbi:MAG: pyruvate, water dikinase, partial [Acidimicrobiaceae bacterium]
MKDLLRLGWPGDLLTNPVDAATLHCDEPNTFAWSRANLAEAMPGVSTPLSWEFTAPSTVSVARSMFAMLGVVSAHELTAPLATAAEAATTLFFGRAALNVDVMRRYIARVPGADPDEFERQVLGRSRGASPEPKERWRLPIVAARLPYNVARFRSQTERNRVEVEAWWKTEVARLPSASLVSAIEAFDDAVRKHVDLVAVHSFGIIIGQAYYSSLAKLCASRGLEGLELDLS